jgi:hypothetical protein
MVESVKKRLLRFFPSSPTLTSLCSSLCDCHQLSSLFLDIRLFLKRSCSYLWWRCGMAVYSQGLIFLYFIVACSVSMLIISVCFCSRYISLCSYYSRTCSDHVSHSFVSEPLQSIIHVSTQSASQGEYDTTHRDYRCSGLEIRGLC